MCSITELTSILSCCSHKCHAVAALFIAEFRVGNTDLSGTIPEEFWLAGGDMQVLSMPNTDIAGTLSTHIGQLTNLHIFNLINTEIGGSIPTEIGKLSNSLEWLQLAHTSITGSFPSELGLVTGLSKCNRSIRSENWPSCRHFGIVVCVDFCPASYIDLFDVSASWFLCCTGTIWLHHTNLEGQVPEEMCDLPAVFYDFRTDCKESDVQCSCCTSCYGF